MNTQFWKDKKVLVTGHSGFKGSWLSFILNSLGAQVTGISKEELNNNKDLFKALKIESICDSFDVDIRDMSGIQDIFFKTSPDIVFHMAAQPLVRKSYKDPLDTYDINVMGTINILEAIKKIETIKASVFITTDKCYENNEWTWGYRENDPMGGHDPYSCSKGCAELIIQSYQKCFFNEECGQSALSSVRAGNVIGGGDLSEDRLIPDLVRAIDTKGKVLIRNPSSTRPWQHVFEPLRGYMMVAEDLYNKGPSANSSWNFGPHLTDIRTVENITDLFCSSWGISDIIEIDKKLSVHEANLLSLDISKAHHELNWTPNWSLEDSMPYIVEWYKAYLKGGDLTKISLSQIKSYFESK
jgi:CDP-glucose 4,6-dehydratase